MPLNLYYPPLNVEVNNKGYDASAEISPTDSKSVRNINQISSSDHRCPEPHLHETVPTPTASHLTRPETYQSNLAKADNLRRSYESQETARMDSIITETNLDHMYSTPKSEFGY